MFVVLAVREAEVGGLFEAWRQGLALLLLLEFSGVIMAHSWAYDPLVSASQVAETTGVSHCAQLKLLLF